MPTEITWSQGERNKEEDQPAVQTQSQTTTPQDRPKPTPGSVSATLRSGRKLCQRFQKGDCHEEASCHSGLHKRGKVKINGRICGMNHHGAHTCNMICFKSPRILPGLRGICRPGHQKAGAACEASTSDKAKVTLTLDIMTKPNTPMSEKLLSWHSAAANLLTPPF